MPKKNFKKFGVIEYIYEYLLELVHRMQIRKKWLNQLKHFFNKHF